MEKTGESFDYKFTSLDHVSGACQVFRRECYEDIGGYAPVKVGTIDCIAVITARMKGWKTRTFTDKVCQHHRKVGTAQRGPVKANFVTRRDGLRHGKPSSLAVVPQPLSNDQEAIRDSGPGAGAGYLWAFLRRAERPVSRELVKFHRREQMERLKNKFTGKALAWRQLRASAR